MGVIAGKGLLLARQSAQHLGALARLLWRLLRPLLAGTLQVLLALIIVFEEWGWRPLADWLGGLARWRPWARIEYAIARLPPYAALLAFAVPTLLLLPLKFVALFLIARGQLMLATGLFIAAKVVATALIARLFELTQPALMQIGWFAWAHDTVMPWKEALTERVRTSWPWRVGRLCKEAPASALGLQWPAGVPATQPRRRGCCGPAPPCCGGGCGRVACELFKIIKRRLAGAALSVRPQPARPQSNSWRA